MQKRYGIAGLALIALLSTAGYVAAADSDTSPVYRPVTSDLMNMVIQPRHIKLWIAGREKNWVFADYERHNLQGALRRMAIAIPNYKGMNTAEMVDTFTTQQFADLDTAIKAKDEKAFVKAYGALTESCNECHQAAHHGYVVVKVPSGVTPFPDQDFRTPVQMGAN